MLQPGLLLGIEAHVVSFKLQRLKHVGSFSFFHLCGASHIHHLPLLLQGTLVAVDINRRRLGLLKTAAAAQGVEKLIRLQTRDLVQYAAKAASQPEDHSRQYDKVLLDAPCSGLGVLAKRWNPHHTISSNCLHLLCWLLGRFLCFAPF